MLIIKRIDWPILFGGSVTKSVKPSVQKDLKDVEFYFEQDRIYQHYHCNVRAYFNEVC